MIPETERIAILGRSWLSPGTVWFGGIKARPFSLGSLLLLDELGLREFESDPEEFASLYCWAHSEPLDRVLWEIRRGNWEKAWREWECDQPVQSWADVEFYLESIAPEIEAAQIEIKERPKTEDSESDPPELIEPHYVGSYVAAISDVVKALPREIVWFVPIGQAFQLVHCALRKARVWTVPPGTAEAAKQEAAEQARQLELAVAGEAFGIPSEDEFAFAELDSLLDRVES